MNPFDLERYLARQRKLIERALRERLPRRQDALARAMRYAALGGGKRIRPVLSLAAVEAVGGDVARALPLACAVEMIHAYSLVHDDLPLMDDDDMRRGRPTTHVVFGEALALLAGDALLTDAFDVAAAAADEATLPASTVLQIIRELAAAAGSAGMVLGQARDMDGAGARRSLAVLETTHRRKTGDLIRCAVRVGAISGGASRTQLAALTRFAEATGLAFQVADDLLDALGNSDATGKRVRRDAALEKLTFPGLLGIEAAWERARQLEAEALAAMERFDVRADPLRALVRHTVARIPAVETAASTGVAPA